MAFSLGFHIVFAAIGMTMPFLMCCAHFLFLKTGQRQYWNLTQMWLKGVAIFFAVGAVSGTVLSFELGLLWPKFMQYAGPIIGMPFSWEGTAFFLEAVAIGLFLYGRKRMHPWLHWVTGLVVGISGFASGVFVVSANAWMNSPSGFDVINGHIENVDPVAAMFNASWLHESLHMQIAAFQAVGFAVGGTHAALLLLKRRQELNLKAVKIAVAFAAVASILQPLSGHFAAQQLAEKQPHKLAAIEGHFHTMQRAPLYVGGIPDVETKTMRWGIPIPGGLSFLAFNDFDAEVTGLDAVDPSLWPPVAICHVAFQIMVGIGTFLALVSIIFVVSWLRKRIGRFVLALLAIASPLGFIAIEAGWIVTEVGRQPWIIVDFLKTVDSVTPVPGLVIHLGLFVTLYVALALMCMWLFARQIQTSQLADAQE